MGSGCRYKYYSDSGSRRASRGNPACATQSSLNRLQAITRHKLSWTFQVASLLAPLVEEVEQQIRGEAISFHLEGLREDGAPVPPPSSQVDYVDIAA